MRGGAPEILDKMATSDEDSDFCLLTIRVVPNGRATRFEGVGDDPASVRIRLAAPPVDGRANEELVRYLSRALGLRRRAIAIVGGEKARIKRVRLDGIGVGEAVARLQADA